MLQAERQLDSDNLGVGSYDLIERAYASTIADNILRVSENGPLGRRFFRSRGCRCDGAARGPARRRGGRPCACSTPSPAAARSSAGGRCAIEIEAATDLDYVRGSTPIRVRASLLEGGRTAPTNSRNYLGTYTFASLADYEAGRPSNYTRRIGDPNVRYTNVQVGPVRAGRLPGRARACCSATACATRRRR